ncbi:MAG: helix-turn-helix domain-containing protein [Candidatus Dormibacteraeota bacterium]|uniref:Helix-turn-helix domain-containing protein n=2 Tax=Candidatus Dormiibacter TaxID=2599625 RepID=A0A934KI11_9BACT|nr:helix-turn-helix domain-containing protein [Candidatus Dormibacteraeota bacterium]MBJ7606013.1 helix-turn-helix domain-containing protein [Candidatus Dormibacteraeota bacterium]
MTKDDRFYLNRVALFAHVERVGVSQACRDFKIHRSTYYRWRRQVLRNGLEILRPRERRLPRMPNQLPVWTEQKIITLALAQPGLGPRRLAAQLAQPNPLGELSVSASGVLKVLHRHGLGTRPRRLALVAGYAAPPERELPPRPVQLHLEAEQPGDLVQIDCFHIGSLSGTKGKVWQYCETLGGTVSTRPDPWQYVDLRSLQ